MTDPSDDLIGLADLDPVEPPAGLFDRLLDVAFDPATPAADGSLLPGGGAEGGADVDLADFDDDDAATGETDTGRRGGDGQDGHDKGGDDADLPEPQSGEWDLPDPEGGGGGVDIGGAAFDDPAVDGVAGEYGAEDDGFGSADAGLGIDDLDTGV